MTTEDKPSFAGVRLARNGPLAWVSAGGFDLQPGEAVVVLMDGDAGMQKAKVVVTPQQFVETPAVKPAGRVVDKLPV